MCEVTCTCTLIPTLQSYRDTDHVIRFLKNLNEQYAAVRSQIMLMKPLPDVDEVFSMLIQQERQLNDNIFDEHKVLANVSDHGQMGRGKYRGRGGRHSSGRYGGGRGGTKVCTYCQKSGHTIDTCNKKHGYPPNYFKNSAVNNYVVDEDAASEDDERSLHLTILIIPKGKGLKVQAWL